MKICHECIHFAINDDSNPYSTRGNCTWHKNLPPMLTKIINAIGAEPTLEKLLDEKAHPYHIHVDYENLHPFTDGNGRSGRALWLRRMKDLGENSFYQALDLGFLHTFYYQTLKFSPNRISP